MIEKSPSGALGPRFPGFAGVKNMKAIVIEPLLMVVSSLLWIIVLPVAAIVCSGIAISDRVENFVARPLGVNCPQPSSPA